MFQPNRMRLMKGAMLALYAFLFVLGDGLHLLPAFHHHPHASSAEHHSDVSKRESKSHCSHGHHHEDHGSHDSHESDDENSSSDHEGHNHSDECDLCKLLALPLIVVDVFQPEFAMEPQCEALSIEVLSVSAKPFSLFEVRGPPALASLKVS